ncbi:DEAD/DEAH box helicase [uncultured Microbulbifer sp.]|uniref:DEAD/DEAH box helicase n=1 Tax=uncultured Microbulbifer sp. TaxID=348147 RepID=UPI00262332A6|nr:DEAD/DEAH box helicase [uncultured Microbulbifer sp.]
MNIPIDFRHISQQLPNNSLVRGKDYFRNGKVQAFNVSHGGKTITGKVSGSYASHYNLQIEIIEDPVMGGFEIDGECSCPVGYNCKHVAAVLMAAVNEIQKTSKLVSNSTNWESWQNNIIGKQRETVLDSPSQRDLLYTLDWDDRYSPAHARVNVYSARPLKKGGYGKPQREYFHINSSLAISKIDQKIFGLQQLLSQSFFRKAISGEEGALLLRNLLVSQRFFSDIDSLTPINWGEAVKLELSWEESKNSAQLQIDMPDLPDGWKLIPTEPPCYFSPKENIIGPIISPVDGEALNDFTTMPAISKSEMGNAIIFLNNHYGSEHLPTPKSLPVIQVNDSLRPVLILKSIPNPGGIESTHTASFHIHYGPVIIPAEEILAENRPENNIYPQENKLYRVERNFHHEAAVLKDLMQWQWSLSANEAGEPTLFFSDGETDQTPIERWHDFLNGGIPRLEEAGWIVEFEDDFSLKVHEIEDWEWQTDQSSNDWFSLSATVDIEGQPIHLAPLILQYLESGYAATDEEDILVPLGPDQYIRLPSALFHNLFAVLEEWYDSESQSLKVPRFAMPELPNADSAWQGNKDLKALAKNLQKGPQSIKPPRALKAQLRPYQQTGFEWLQHLRKLGMNGILADDMGLGKTLQGLAHILKEKESRRLINPALVVVPTSLVGNWLNEAQRFAPTLKALLLHGSDRHEDFPLIPESDLVITTYPLIVRDSDLLKEYNFHLLILDEAQVIKNPKSKAAQLLRTLTAQHKVCLTGTPLENHLGELWALFDYLMPGFLHSQKRFNGLYRNPIEKQANEHKQGILNQRIAPFILRRTKQEVATELPSKTEIIQRVTLDTAQAALYETVRSAMEKRVRDLMKKKGLNRSHIEMLDALLKLRQICCDPGLVKLEKAKKVKQSAKLEALMDMLPEMVEEGRKVLLFSQFTEMLGKIETALEEQAIPYVKLTGRTRKRQEAIDAFQNGDIPVFLISLKAGGVGLNLTAADTVIHYDPWWNPAVENQATDRAYRIGQDKPVFVYKFICENTVEEKIIDMQSHKQALADAIYDKDGKNITMDSDQWLSLFQD